MNKTLLILFTVFTLAACSENETIESVALPDGTNLRINYFTRICYGPFEQQCLLSQEDELLGTDDWNYFYNTIGGFEFESGFIYNLEIKKTEIENPPQDASSITYDMVKLISKVPVTCEFENPSRDLDWLRFEIQEREANITEDTKYCYITQAEVNQQPVFVFWDCNPVIAKIIPVVDCLGNTLSFLGDSISLDDLKNQKIVWQPEIFVCEPAF